MLFLLSVVALIVGACLWWIDEAGFDDDCLDVQWRKRLGVGNVGQALIVLGIAGAVLDGYF